MARTAILAAVRQKFSKPASSDNDSDIDPPAGNTATESSSQKVASIAKTPAHLLLPSDLLEVLSPSRMAAIYLIGFMEEKDRRRHERTLRDANKHIRRNNWAPKPVQSL